MNQEEEEGAERGGGEGGGGDSGVGREALKTNAIQQLAPCQFGGRAAAHPRPHRLLPDRPLKAPPPTLPGLSSCPVPDCGGGEGDGPC